MNRRYWFVTIICIIIFIATTVMALGQQPKHLNPKQVAHVAKQRDGVSSIKKPISPSNLSKLIASDSVSVGPVYADTKTKVFYWPECPKFNRIALKDRRIFGDDDEAKNAGFRPAKNCQ